MANEPSAADVAQALASLRARAAAISDRLGGLILAAGAEAAWEEEDEKEAHGGHQDLSEQPRSLWTNSSNDPASDAELCSAVFTDCGCENNCALCADFANGNATAVRANSMCYTCPAGNDLYSLNLTSLFGKYANVSQSSSYFTASYCSDSGLCLDAASFAALQTVYPGWYALVDDLECRM